MKKILLIGVIFGLAAFTNAQNKILYGLASMGGAGNYGVLFGYDVNSSTYTVKKNFGTVADGIVPRGSLTQASNGKLYGMTYLGGTNNFGTLFEYDQATESYAVKVNFTPTNGTLPFGNVVQASNGKLYGMTSKGGAGNFGTLFEYDPATAVYAVKVSFSGVNGNQANGSLVLASNGKLYGMTNLSAVLPNDNRGILFEYDPATAAYVVKIEFNGSNGNRPYGDLTEANGKLYGMTREGGANGLGNLFEFDPISAVMTSKVNFGGANGKNPMVVCAWLLTVSFMVWLVTAIAETDLSLNMTPLQISTLQKQILIMRMEAILWEV